MKIRLLYAFLLASVSLSVAALDRQADGQTAADFFVNAPFDIASQLTETSRLDMIDYFTNGSTVKSENRLGRKVALKRLDDNMIVWQDDDSVTTSIVVLPGDPAYLLVIRTFGGDRPDSDVLYFDEGWNPVERASFPRPKLNDWLLTTDKNSRREVEDSLPFLLWTAEYDLADNVLVFTNRLPDYYPASDRPDALDKLKPELRYQWNGRQFKAINAAR